MSSLAFPQALKRGFIFAKQIPFSVRGQSVRSIYRNTNNPTSSSTLPKSEDNVGSSKKASSSTEGKLDPFGIEDIDDRSSTVLVQGFYEYGWKKGAKPGVKVEDRRSEISNSASIDEGSSKLQAYQGWIKQRQEIVAKEKVEAESEGPAENYRTTSFGNVRLDSDNTVEHDGQYDESYRRPSLQHRAQRPTSNSQNFKEAENDSMSGRMTAHEFLKKFKEEKSQELKASSEEGRAMISKPVRPRPSKQEEDFERFSRQIVDSGSLDSNIIPKEYQTPNFNSFTQQDVWGLLKKRVIFQNEFLLAISKPYGIPIHSAAVDCRHYITQFLDRFADVANCKQVFPLHRLDKETTGVLLFAKDQKIAKYIIEKFSLRQIDKTYLAITKMCPQVPEGTIKIPIGEGRFGGAEKFRSVLKPDLRKYEIKTRQSSCREAITHFTVIKSTQDAAFLQVKPETGLKHQIRLHLGLGLGCPIIGDHKYSHRDRMAPQRLSPALLHRIKVKQSKVRELPLHLHCNSISFTLPGADDPVYIHANVPLYFKHTLKAFGLK